MKHFASEGEQCPYCRVGILVPRVGRFSRFLGCDQYPRCAGVAHEKEEKETEDLDEATNDFLKRHGREVDLIR